MAESVDGYYRSPAWRRAGYRVIGIVIVYLIAMVAYFGVAPAPRRTRS